MNEILGPQPGTPQELAAHCPADVIVYGGQRGGGKTAWLLMEAAKWVDVPNFGAVIFRRYRTEVTEEGGLWDTSWLCYPHCGGVPTTGKLYWDFPSGARITFAGLEDEKALTKWLGGQICCIGFDQIEAFTEKMFWEMFGCNRSTCGVQPYIRATCNPIPRDDKVGGWLNQMIDWYIDQETGYPIEDRDCKMRWMTRDKDELMWSSDPEELVKYCDPGDRPTSFTFVRARLEDNPALVQKDPRYAGRLKNMGIVAQLRFLRGNWNAREKAGDLFPAEAWRYVASPPPGARWYRYWDKAASSTPTACRTAGVLVGMTGQGPTSTFYIADCKAERKETDEREELIKNTAYQDRSEFGWTVQTGVEEEGGSGGKDSARWTVKNLAGFNIEAHRKRTNKVMSWGPLSSQVRRNNVYIVTGDIDHGQATRWNYHEFIRVLSQLSGDEKKDANLLKDEADAASGAFNKLTGAEGVYLDRPLLCSGGDYEGGGDVNQPLTEDELTGLPDVLADIMRGARRDSGGYGRD